MLAFNDPCSGVVKAVRNSCDDAAGGFVILLCMLMSVCEADRRVSH